MRYLIIRPGAIGDTLLTLPILSRLRSQRSAQHITFVGNAAVLSILLSCGVIDEGYDFEERRWSRLFIPGAYSSHVEEYDCAICWLRDLEGIVERNLRSAGIEQVVIAPGRPVPGERVHVVEYLASTLELDWQFERDGGQTCIHLPMPPEKRIEDSAVVVHPGSGGAHKCWPVEHFAALISDLWVWGYQVVLLGGPAEEERLGSLQEMLGEVPRAEELKVLINWPLLEVAEVLQRCRAYIGNDSGLTHLAGMLGVPTVALFGASDVRQWHPLGPRVRVVRGEGMEKISVEQVITEIGDSTFRA